MAWSIAYLPVAAPSGGTSESDITTFGIEGSGTEFVSFGHPFPRGAVPSGKNAVITDGSNNVVSSAQTDRLALHSDGSLKHGMFHASLTPGSAYKIRVGTPISGTSRTISDLLAAIADADIASVTLSAGITGVASLRDLLTSSTNRSIGGIKTLEQGPTCLALAVSQRFSTHLLVHFHVRWYGGTVLMVNFIFENRFGTTASSGSKTYSASCVINGVEVNSTAVTQFNGTQWHTGRKWSTGGTHYVKHNVAYLKFSRAFANFDSAYTPSGTFLNAARQSVSPMGIGDISTPVDGTGFHPQLGLQPQWDAVYLEDSDERAFNYMKANNDASMSFPVVLLDTATDEPITITSYPGRCITDLPASSPAWPANTFSSSATTFTQLGSHLWDAGYTPYVVTGDYAYLRLMHHYAGYVIMEPASRPSSGAASRWYRNSLRGMAWCYRTCGHAAYITPDSHSLKSYFTNALESNIGIDNGLYGVGGSAVNALGTWFMAEGNTEYRAFYHYFLSQVLGHIVCDLGYENARDMAKYAGLFIANLMGADGKYNYQFAANYTLAMGATSTGWYADYAEVALNNIPAGGQAREPGTAALATWMDANIAEHSGVRHELNGNMGGTDASQYYYANMQPAIAYLEELGVLGGKWAWMRARLSGVWPAYGNEPMFSIVPYAETNPTSKPSWLSAITVGNFGNANATTSNTIRGSLSTGEFGATYYAWSGAVVATDGINYLGTFIPGKFLVLHGGGHTDSSLNHVMAYGPIDGANPIWYMIAPPSNPPANNTAFASDGRPVSSHCYNLQSFAPEPFNWMLRMGTGSRYIDGGGGNGAGRYDLSGNGALGTEEPWDALPSVPMTAGAQYFPHAFSCYDPVRHKAWMHTTNSGNAGLKEYRMRTQAWTERAGFDMQDTYPTAVCDYKQNLMVTVNNSGNVRVWDLDNPSNQHTTPTTNGADKPTGGLVALTWDPVRNVYYAWQDSSQKYWKYTPPATNPGSNAWTVTAHTASGTNPGRCAGIQQAPGYDTGTYGRWSFMPDLDCVAIVNNYAQPVHFLRVA